MDLQRDGTASFVLHCQTRLQKILERLEWTQAGVLKNFNTNSLASELKENKPKQQDKPAKQIVYPPTVPNKNSCTLDTPDLQNLLQNDQVQAPNNFLELQANFLREEKLQIYEHVIQNTQKLDNNTEAKVPEGEQSLAQIVAEKKREAKRKKRKFRIAKPTHIEEVRALVDLQMQSLQQFISNQKGFEKRRNIEARDKAYSDIRSRDNIKQTRESYPREYDRNYGGKYNSSSSRKHSDRHWKSSPDNATNKNKKSDDFENKRWEDRLKYSEKTSRHSSSYDIQQPRERESSKRDHSIISESKNYDQKRKGKKNNKRSRSPLPYKIHDSLKEERLDSKKYKDRDKLPKRESSVELPSASKRFKDSDDKRRSRSREKHYSYKKKHKKSRSRSKSRDTSRKHKHKRNKHKHKYKE